MTETALLSARAVSKRVNDGGVRREVLREITLEVRRGEVVVVRGASGSGKTTLLAILGGMLLPTSGEVWLGDEPISRLRDHQRAAVRREKIGYVFQDFGLIERMTVIENVLLPLVPSGGATRDALARAADILDSLGIASMADVGVSRLSGGERQRVALARARVLGPLVLLLDEPTAHLDEARARLLMDDFVRMQGEGTAVVIASHDPRICDDARVTRRLDLSGGVLS